RNHKATIIRVSQMVNRTLTRRTHTEDHSLWRSHPQLAQGLQCHRNFPALTMSNTHLIIIRQLQHTVISKFLLTSHPHRPSDKPHYVIAHSSLELPSNSRYNRLKHFLNIVPEETFIMQVESNLNDFIRYTAIPIIITHQISNQMTRNFSIISSPP